MGSGNAEAKPTLIQFVDDDETLLFTSATEATTHLLRLYKIDNNSNTLWQRDLASSATANAFHLTSTDWHTTRQVLLTGISSATALAQLPTYISVGHPADDRSIDWLPCERAS